MDDPLRSAATRIGPEESVRRIVANVGGVVHAPDETLQLSVLCLLAEGHLIIEDLPGVGNPPLADGGALPRRERVDPPTGPLGAGAAGGGVLGLMGQARAIFVGGGVNRCVGAPLRQAREDDRLYVGASPRAGIALLRVAKAK